MSSIKLLDDITIQQIAAGEIIDRPAAIVKEVIENSIDAEASTITVEIKNGGKTYIRVTDNGEGIAEDDIELAFERHSTSKLDKAEDLYDIHSFGFRGEALASIAAVSKLELITKTRDARGVQAFLENGELLEKEPVGCPNGTTLIMRDIFYNFPVRRDFLKSDLVESNRITDTVTRLALGNPSISFKYIKDGRVVFKSPGKGDLMQTIYSILGREFHDSLIDLSYEEQDIKLSGYISKNSFYRSNRSHQYLYVNNRYIKNQEIVNAIEAEYRSLIPINRYPIFFLFIDLDPAKVDVNIHPTKEEINFVDQKNILDLIGKTIGEHLNKSLEIQSVPSRVKAKKENSIPKLYESTFFDKKEGLDSIDREGDKDNQRSGYIRESSYRENEADSFDKGYNMTSLIDRDEDIYKLPELEKEEFQDLEEDMDSDDLVKEDSYISSQRENFISTMENLNILGSIFKTYIVAEDRINRDLILIDQHAAHERIKYEEYLKKYREADISTQLLMTPEVIDLSDIEYSQFEDNLEFFNSIGFSIEAFGGTSIIIRGLPMIFGRPEARTIFFDVLDSLKDNLNNPYEVKLDKIMKMACTSSIKSGDSITKLEIDELIRLLLETETPFTCPHGRPTIIKINEKDIEKDFKRIM